jgi:hypothetical protein
MSLFSSIKNKFKEDTGMNVLIQPDILNDLKNELKSQSKDVVRFEVVDFG